jgi:hypothetical protein
VLIWKIPITPTQYYTDFSISPTSALSGESCESSKSFETVLR